MTALSSPPCYPLLALCARPHLPEEVWPALRTAAAGVSAWDSTLDAAEEHGLGPLLHRHVRAASVAAVPGLRLQLASLYLRHRHRNGVKLRALSELLEALAGESIEARVLKGPALMFLVYGDPALRPVSDLDVLVPSRDAARAQELLQTLGYRAPAAAGDHHHLPTATRSTEGVLVHVEIHRDAFVRDGRASLELDGTREAPLTFDLFGRPALALGPHEMLWHVAEHMVGPLPRPLRLIWLADVLGCATAFADRIDWSRLAREAPVVLNALAFAHHLTPLPEPVLARIPARALRVQAGGGMPALAWTPRGGVRAGGRRAQFERTLMPPDWWMALRYGRGGRTGSAVSRVQHLSVFARASRRRVDAAMAGRRP